MSNIGDFDGADEIALNPQSSERRGTGFAGPLALPVGLHADWRSQAESSPQGLLPVRARPP
jgi:hypothetical protein